MRQRGHTESPRLSSTSNIRSWPLADLAGLPGDGDWEMMFRDLNLGTEGRLRSLALDLNCSSALFQNSFE